MIGSDALNANLSDRKILPVKPGIRPLTEEEALLLIGSVRKEWRLVDYGGIMKLESGFRFAAYADSCKFVGLISRLCRENGYAPDITFGKDYAFVALFTHEIQGLHNNEFIMAAKIDELLSE